MADTAAGPLAGVRILDLTRLLPGPMATAQLAGLGAEVIKIEDAAGDPARAMGPRRGRVSEVFRMLNDGKRFLMLDLKQRRDREDFLALLPQADAVVESFRPGTLERLGLGWPVLQQANPRLVLCSISGYGQGASQAGHDINYLALAGVLDQNAGQGGAPALPGLPVADALGAQTAATELVAALLHARVHGQGRHLDVALAAAAFHHNVLARAEAAVHGRPQPAGTGLLTGGAPCYGVYRCADGRYLAVGALEYKFWEVLCRALQRPDLADGHWTRGQAPGGREALRMRSELESVFAARALHEWAALLGPLDCCVTPVLRADEAGSHPYFADRGPDQDI